MKALSRTIALVWMLVLAGAALGEQHLVDPLAEDLTPSQRLTALLGQMRARHEALSTLEADFIQNKNSMMFVQPSVARGVFSYAAPNSVRWEYAEPDPISLLIADGRMTTWYRDLDRAETTGVGEHSQRILQYMGASTSVDKLLEYFSVSLSLPKSGGDPFRLRLDPRFKRVEKRVRVLEVWIDAELYLPLKLRFIEGDGDVTEYEFSNLRLNEGIPDDRFSLEIPERVEVRSVDAEAKLPRS